MTYDEKLVSRVRNILQGRRGVVEKNMMGSRVFMVNGSMCCAVGPDGLLVRIDTAEREELLADPLVSSMKLGARTMKGFLRIAPEAFRTDASLSKWIERGVAAGATKRKIRRN